MVRTPVRGRASDTIEGRITPEKQSRRSANLIPHDNLEAALVDAAEAVIATDGLVALRARAERVGCSVGAIYSVFADLDGTILAVNARTLRQIETIVTATARGSRDPAAG